MSVNIRPFPTLTGRDAEIFLKRQEENKKLLEEKVSKFIENQNNQIKK